MSSSTRGFGPVSRALLAATVISIAGMAGPAAAQIGGGTGRPVEVRINPPTPKKADAPPILWSYLVLIIILAAVVTANMIPSKRGHQD